MTKQRRRAHFAGAGALFLRVSRYLEQQRQRGGLVLATRDMCFFAMILLAGCGGTWQQNTRKALVGVIVAGKAAHAAVKGDAFCRPVVNLCKQQRKTSAQCEALKECQAAQIRLVLAIGELFRAVQVVNEGIGATERLRR